MIGNKPGRGVNSTVVAPEQFSCLVKYYNEHLAPANSYKPKFDVRSQQQKFVASAISFMTKCVECYPDLITCVIPPLPITKSAVLLDDHIVVGPYTRTCIRVILEKKVLPAVMVSYRRTI